MKRSQFIKTLLGGALCAASVFVAVPTEAQAMPDPSDPRVATLRIRIQTGDDDLRSASQAIALLDYTTPDGNHRDTSAGLNNGGSWGNWSFNTVDVPMPGDVHLSRLDELTIEFNSGQSNPFDTGDNWNMQSITVTAILDDEEATQVILIQDAGNPLHRFKSDNNTTWTETF